MLRLSIHSNSSSCAENLQDLTIDPFFNSTAEQTGSQAKGEAARKLFS